MSEAEKLGHPLDILGRWVAAEFGIPADEIMEMRISEHDGRPKIEIKTRPKMDEVRIAFRLTDEYRPRRRPSQERPIHFSRAAFVEVSPSEREMVAYALRNTPMIGPDFTEDDRAAFERLAERFER